MLMTTWPGDELNKIGSAEELEIASLQQDGTLGKSTTIWMVRVGDDLYVRPVNGRTGAWYRGTQIRHEGRIQAGGIDKDVTFVDVDINDPVNTLIDAVYHTKYSHYAQYVPPVLTPKARAATLKIVPRVTSA
jgi:hypothetical protein